MTPALALLLFRLWTDFIISFIATISCMLFFASNIDKGKKKKRLPTANTYLYRDCAYIPVMILCRKVVVCQIMAAVLVEACVLAFHSEQPHPLIQGEWVLTPNLVVSQ